MSLCKAIKLVGGAGRREKMWRKIAAPAKDRYGDSREVRDKTHEMAKPTITQQQAAALATEAARWAGGLRAAIAVANATAVEREINDDLLF
jgi:hypothetical protein